MVHYLVPKISVAEIELGRLVMKAEKFITGQGDGQVMIGLSSRAGEPTEWTVIMNYGAGENPDSDMAGADGHGVASTVADALREALIECGVEE